MSAVLAATGTTALLGVQSALPSDAYASSLQSKVNAAYKKRIAKNASGLSKNPRYKKVDLDGNGIKELLVHNGCGMVVYTYSKKKGKAIRLAKMGDEGGLGKGNNWPLYYSKKKHRVLIGYQNTGGVYWKLVKIKGTKAKTLKRYSSMSTSSFKKAHAHFKKIWSPYA